MSSASPAPGALIRDHRQKLFSGPTGPAHPVILVSARLGSLATSLRIGQLRSRKLGKETKKESGRPQHAGRGLAVVGKNHEAHRKEPSAKITSERPTYQIAIQSTIRFPQTKTSGSL